MVTDSRYKLLEHWIKQSLGWHHADIQVASTDASFRRYFRVHYQDQTTIAMDAPPEKEDIKPFIDITHRLQAAKVHAPEIIAQNIDQGFLLLEDLGSTPYQDVLSPQRADHLYHQALQALLRLQQADTTGIPSYNEKRLLEEMELIPEWFLKSHLGIKLNPTQYDVIKNCFEQLVKAINEQPTGFVHRDYHSRNLMYTRTNNPGVIDYQDAVKGPLSYDVASLLRDCYILWPEHKVNQWALGYKQDAVKQGLMPAQPDELFLRDLELMGLQRHIKVLGIFARLYHRDGKSQYLDDLPLTLSYVLKVGARHTETQALVNLIKTLNIPETIGSVDIPA